MRWSWALMIGCCASSLACGGSARRDDGATTSAGGSGASGSGGNTSGGAGASGAAGSAGGVSCDDTILRPEDDPFQTCPNLGPVCRPLCEDATGRMKAAIAGRTIRCMASECMCPGPISECETRSMTCMLDRLATACDDTSANDDCAHFEALCVAQGGPSCHSMIDGLTEAARAEVSACVNGGCDGGLEACVRRVLMP